VDAELLVLAALDALRLDGKLERARSRAHRPAGDRPGQNRSRSI
jgi:hypothetical protein